jgi:nicotinamidase-related amidase
MTDDLRRDYAEAGFGGDLGYGARRALLMIDFAHAYFEPTSPLYIGGEGPKPAAQALLAAARRAGMPIVHTRVQYGAGGLDGGIFVRKVGLLATVFAQGSALGEFEPGLEPQANEIVITKQYASAFFGTSLASTLCAANIDALLIAGLSTSGCVRASAVDAMQHGFIPLVVRDAVGDRDRRPHEANLFDLQAKYANVLGLDQALDLIRAGR